PTGTFSSASPHRLHIPGHSPQGFTQAHHFSKEHYGGNNSAKRGVLGYISGLVVLCVSVCVCASLPLSLSYTHTLSFPLSFSFSFSLHKPLNISSSSLCLPM